MADETNDGLTAAAGDENAAALAAFERLSDEEKRNLLAGDKVEALSEEEILSRLSGLDSGATLGHDEVAEGLAHELSSQRKVIDLLSDQREEASLNIAKVLDSSAIDLDFLMAVQVKDPTRTIIGPEAESSRRENIKSEINLPTKTAFQMCWNSVLIRLGRVAITASGIFLGIAFYSSVRMTSLVLAAAHEAQDDQARQTWLIIMALMVSVVGICNSMLMAVTERFQEIGTMKCLGALDQFIVKLFLIESGMLGGLAGFLGSLVGVGLMYIVNAMKYNFTFLAVAPGMAMTVLISIVLGTVLSIMAAILPARQAALMPAAAALRTTV